MKKIEITITLNVYEGISFIDILRKVGFFFWAGVLQRAGATIDHVFYDSDIITIERVHNAVCKYGNLNKNEIMLPTRKAEVRELRQIAMKLSRDMISPKPSLSQIGKYFGGKTHATVINSCKVIDNHIETEKAFSQKIEEIKKLLLSL